MKERRADLLRFEALVEQRAEGGAWSDDDELFVRRFVAEHPECAHELSLYAELAELDSSPDEASRALVDAALARMELEEAADAANELALLRRRRVPAWVMVAGAAAVAGVVFLALFSSTRTQDADLRARTPQRPTRAELVYASGAVSVSGKHASVGQTLLSEQSVLETGDGAACVLIEPEINVCLAPRTRLLLGTLEAPARVLVLEAGKVATRLAMQPEGMSLSITASGVPSTAIGTAFSVEHGEDGRVVTTVLNGRVRVGPRERSQIVNAHERAVVTSERVAVSPISRSEEAPSWALLGPTNLWRDPTSATLEIRGEPVHAEALLDGQPIGRVPLSTLIPVGAHRLVVRQGDQLLFEGDFQLQAGETQEIRYALPEPRVESVPAPKPVLDAPKSAGKSIERSAKVLAGDRPGHRAPESATSTSTVKSAGQLLGEARKSVIEGQFVRAAATYEEIIRAHPSSAEAHTVLVSLGQLRLNQLHEPALALKSLDRYLAQGGPLAEEARSARIRALRKLERPQAEAAAIEEFLAKHPRSFEVGALRARLDQLRSVP